MKAIKCKSGWIIKCTVHGWHIVPDRWQSSGTPDCPTFSPSVREFEYNPDNHAEQTTRCHYTVTAGKIIYHGDNAHEYKGQTLDMLEWTREEIMHYAEGDYGVEKPE